MHTRYTGYHSVGSTLLLARRPITANGCLLILGCAIAGRRERGTVTVGREALAVPRGDRGSGKGRFCLVLGKRLGSRDSPARGWWRYHGRARHGRAVAVRGHRRLWTIHLALCINRWHRWNLIIFFFVLFGAALVRSGLRHFARNGQSRALTVAQVGRQGARLIWCDRVIVVRSCRTRRAGPGGPGERAWQ